MSQLFAKSIQLVEETATQGPTVVEQQPLQEKTDEIKNNIIEGLQRALDEKKEEVDVSH